MKEKPEICPKCKGRLFLANRDGTKTCASCGATIGTPYADARGSKPAGNNPASTELCPSCGSQADYDSTDASGRPVYSCKFCGNKFSPKPVAAPAPQAPAAPSAPKEEKPEILDGREIFALARSNTVEIHAVFSDAGSAGSGFFICPNYIITNAHVVFDHKDTILGHAAFGAKKVSVCFKGGRQFDAEIVFYNLEEDMALLKTNLPCTSVARISKTMPETGETIYAVGNSAGQGMCILQGIVADQLKAFRLVNARSLAVVVAIFGLALAVLMNNYAIMRRKADESTSALALSKQKYTTDHLTGVTTRHSFADKENEVNGQIALGTAEPFAVAVCDVNGLKHINDTYGHKAGDEHIRRACDMICHIFSHSPVYRMGGDEFVVFLRGVDFENRHALMQSLHDLCVAHIGSGEAVVAGGLADYSEGRDTKLRDVFDRADALMYKEKKALKALGARTR